MCHIQLWIEISLMVNCMLIEIEREKERKRDGTERECLM